MCITLRIKCDLPTENYDISSRYGTCACNDWCPNPDIHLLNRAPAVALAAAQALAAVAQALALATLPPTVLRMEPHLML